MDVRIIGIMSEYDDGTVGYWDGFYLTEEEQNAILDILSKHDTEGYSVRGNLEEIRNEI